MRRGVAFNMVVLGIIATVVLTSSLVIYHQGMSKTGIIKTQAGSINIIQNRTEKESIEWLCNRFKEAGDWEKYRKYGCEKLYGKVNKEANESEYNGEHNITSSMSNVTGAEPKIAAPSNQSMKNFTITIPIHKNKSTNTNILPIRSPTETEKNESREVKETNSVITILGKTFNRILNIFQMQKTETKEKSTEKNEKDITNTNMNNTTIKPIQEEKKSTSETIRETFRKIFRIFIR